MQGRIVRIGCVGSIIYRANKQPQKLETSCTNQGSNFQRGCFSNRNNVRVPTLFRGERQH